MHVRIHVPSLIIQADADPVVNPESGRTIVRRLGARDKVLTTLPFDRHMIVRGHGSREVFEATSRFIERVAVEETQQAA